MIVDGLPEDIDIMGMRQLYKMNAEGVMIYKYKKYGQESQRTVHLIFDFKARL